MWHELIGFEPQLTRAMNGSGDLDDIHTTGGFVDRSVSLTHLSCGGCGTVLIQELKAQLLPDLFRFYSLSQVTDLASLIQVLGIKIPQSPPSTWRPVTDYMSGFQLHDLRKFLG